MALKKNLSKKATLGFLQQEHPLARSYAQHKQKENAPPPPYCRSGRYRHHEMQLHEWLMWQASDGASQKLIWQHNKQ